MLADKRFVRYADAEMYGLSKEAFKKSAREAKAIFIVGNVRLVSCQIFEEYYHLPDKADRKERKFIRYADADMYGLGITRFREIVADANASYKIGQTVIISTKILDEYLEDFRIR